MCGRAQLSKGGAKLQIRWSGREYAPIPRRVCCTCRTGAYLVFCTALPSPVGCLGRVEHPLLCTHSCRQHACADSRSAGDGHGQPNFKGDSRPPLVMAVPSKIRVRFAHTCAGARSCLRMVASCKTGGADACTVPFIGACRPGRTTGPTSRSERACPPQ